MRNHRKRLKKEGFARKAVASLLWVSAGWVLSAEAVAALPEINRVERGSAAIRAGNGLYRSAEVGDRLDLNEAVLPSARSRVVVTCPNNTRRRVTPGRLSGIGIICPDVRTAQRSRNENDLLLLNGGVFPYITRVVDDRPATFAWPELLETETAITAGAGAQRYVVSLHRLGQDAPVERVWQAETAETFVAYDGPPLEMEVTYGLIVEVAIDEQTDKLAGELCGEGAVAERDSGAGRFRRGLCFRENVQRLTADEASELAAAVMAIEAEGVEGRSLAGELQTLALGDRYAESGVHSAVVDLLAPLVANGEQGSEQPGAVYALLAESYLRLGHIEQAQVAYRKAEELAVRAGDYPTRLAANLGLAKVAAWRMRPERAVDYLWAALRDVSYVRDGGEADVIVQWLDKLE